MAYYDEKKDNRPRFGNTSNGKYYNNSNQQDSVTTPKQEFENANFQSIWITDKADVKMIEFTERIGKYMADNKLTNSKIRSIYGEIKRIQMGEFEKEKASFFLLRPKVAYALGRDDKNKGLEMFKILFDTCYNVVIDKKTFINFCNMIEAVLAYHKSYGGKEQ